MTPTISGGGSEDSCFQRLVSLCLRKNLQHTPKKEHTIGTSRFRNDPAISSGIHKGVLLGGKAFGQRTWTSIEIPLQDSPLSFYEMHLNSNMSHEKKNSTGYEIHKILAVLYDRDPYLG